MCHDLTTFTQYGNVIDFGRIIFIRFNNKSRLKIIIPKYGPDYIIQELSRSKKLHNECMINGLNHSDDNNSIFETLGDKLYDITSLEYYCDVFDADNYHFIEGEDYIAKRQLFINRGGKPVKITLNNDDDQLYSLKGPTSMELLITRKYHNACDDKNGEPSEIFMSVTNRAAFYNIADIRIQSMRKLPYNDIHIIV
jgi:hypothetical protein